MKKKGLLIILVLCCFILQGCGLKANINAPYYGKITVGKVTFDMLSSRKEMLELGLDSRLFNRLEEEESGDIFYYESDDEEDEFDVEFAAYNDNYIKHGYDNYDDICEYIELPGNIKFGSTIDEVKKVYGTPNETLEGADDYTPNLEYTILKYESDKEAKAYIILNLYFDSDTKELFKVKYLATIKK